MTPPSVSNLTAVVTGPTAGIGREFAEQLARRGHPLLLVSRDASRLDALAGALSRKYDVRATALAADLSTDDGIERAHAALMSQGDVGVLVNNAGFGTIDRLARVDPESQVRMVRLHALAPMRLTQAVLPGMMSRDRGWIINVSSIAAFVYSPGNVNYSATKAYLTRLTQVLATELVGTGVVVQSLCPGFTHTEFHERGKMDMRHVPRWLWLSPDRVVRESIAAAERGRPLIVIPGLRFRLLTALTRLIPHGVLHHAGRLTRRGREDEKT
jgi:short-subunit dehydrogenase